MSKSIEKAESSIIRLNKYIAKAGVCSRREADKLIEAGLIKVNNKIITQLGYKISLKDSVKYKGRLLSTEKNVYVLLNKPKDFITTNSDERNRKTVMHLVNKAAKERIYPVGRLDRNTTGLLLFTNDGIIAQKLMHPSSKINKIYHTVLNKPFTEDHMNKIRQGVRLKDGEIKIDNIEYVEGYESNHIGVELHSGKNRIIRRIFEHLGYDVDKLDRVCYAGLTKKNLPRGKWRYLNNMEVLTLKRITGKQKVQKGI